ncbi:DnaJ domain-containing protein [Candidatus Marithrix sp. Canyon 246]|uniref:DnaJ domain-containing protein n=1 Tax=Candidatus Marithrix sp. Canyon 246 TaxID=1827136 RepID=UPI000AE2F00F|nr:DnaJ domain-containing protein [Candidatus Marithrix sp. Canyon 246]
MASNKYFYQVLGVQSNANQDEIKQAFHKLAHKYHPDTSTEPNAEQKFQDINEAYTALRNKKPVNKKRSKLPIIAAAIVGITSLVAIISFFYQNSFNTQEIQTGILNHNSEAIHSLENANINFAKKVISGTGVKVALIDFYLKNPPLWKKLDSYHNSIRTNILKDDQVYRRLRDHYYHQIDNEIKEDKFKKAMPLLGEIKKAYPKKSELFHKYQQIQEKKQQRLAAMTQKYMDCLYKTWVPLLERTHCMVDARDTIKTVGIEHDLPIDANLPAMYAKEVRLALKDQNYDHADDILLDWEKLLPANSGQRDVLKDLLYLRRERENIVVDLSGNDKMQVAKRLHQLSADPVLQQQILEIAKVKNNILKYQFNDLLTIIASNYGEMSPNNESKLREILEIPEEVEDEDKTIVANTPIAIPIPIQTTATEEVKTNNKTDTLLTECQQLYNKNYLTRGKNTALSCYRKVLKIEPNNNQALDGLNNIENKYYVWADSNLRKNKFGRVKFYIQALQKFNSNSSRLTGLKEKLNAAQRQTVAEANQATKVKEAAKLARLKVSKEKAVKEREARLKADKERAAKRRSARYKVAKAKVAKERAAKRKTANAKAAKERAAKRKVARAKAAQERAAKRKLARAKAANERKAAKRKVARAKAANERAAKRKLARAKAANERRAAKRKVARAKAANERAAKRKLARAKAAQERAAKRKLARAKAANERRAAKRKAARAKAAQERAAKRKLARAKAANERRAAKRKVARAKAAQERAAKRKVARAKAANERAAKRKVARAKAANERRAAKRKVARAKAANERAAKRKVARAKAANERRAAKRKVARAKAAQERAAKRKVARAKAAQERAAKRKVARAKAANERKAAKRKAARAKAAQERAAKRKVARAKAAQERAAKRKVARAKAANERRAAKRKAARAKAAQERRAKRKADRRAKAAKASAARRKAARAKAIKERAAARRKAKRKRKAAKKKAAKRKNAKRKRGASCSRLVRQMSTGIKPLTSKQRAYFRRRCR